MSRTMYSPDGNRPLSPITERTTPGSFRTAIGLPSVDVVDYQSEREDGPPSPDGSLYSRRSTETITPRPAGPIEQSPDPPHNLSKNDVSDAEPIPPLQSTALLGDAVAPGGLPPPPRPIPYSATSVFAGDTDGLVRGEARRRYMARYFPKADGGKGQAEHRGEETKSEGDHGSGIAGIGANGARGGTVRSRPSSFHAGTPGSNAPSPGELAFLHPLLQPGDLPPLISSDLEQHPEYHNIPFVPEHHAEIWANSPSGKSSPIKVISRSPATSRPSSIKQRPHSFHGSQPGSRKHSWKGDLPAATSDEAVKRSPDSDVVSPTSSSRPSLKGHLSETSLPRSQSSTSLSGRLQRRKSPPRRRIVSSIFGSLFGSSPKDTPGSPPKKLSRRRRISQTDAKAITPPTDLDHSAEVPVTGEGLVVAEPITAIRTSGTFGIRDDGSDVYGQTSDLDEGNSPGSPRPNSIRHRAQSGSGSVQSFAAQRVLFVKNVDDVVVEDDETIPLPLTGTMSPVEEASTEESGDTREAFYTPIGIGSPASSLHELRIDTARPTGETPAGIALPRFTHRRSMSPPSARSAMFMPLEQTLQQRPLTPPPSQIMVQQPTLGTPLPSPFPMEYAQSIGSSAFRPALPFVPITEKEEMVDAFPQMSPRMTTSPKRPLPVPPISRPPSTIETAPPGNFTPPKVGVSQHLNPPLLNIPPPPSGSPSPRLSTDAHSNGQPQAAEAVASAHSSRPTSDLPLLIASHLLSTHAAALMRHSATMRDVSEVMHQMAQESLEWGAILLGMSQSGKQQLPPPTQSLQRGSFGSHPQPFPEAQRDSNIDGLPGRSYAQGSPSDPLKEALEKLNGLSSLGISTSPSPFDSRVQHPYDLRGVTSNTMTTEESDRFTPIPQRHTASRKSSRRQLQPDQVHAPTQPTRQRHESLPADWLGEADRLGREGWESLRKAEEAWSSAMTSLKALADPSPTSTPINEFQQALYPSDPRETEPTVRARTRSRHASLDMSFPRKMERADTIARDGKSFLPSDRDMLDSNESIHTGDMAKVSKILGPNSGIEGLETIRPRPLPPPTFQRIDGGTGGYTAEHLGYIEQEIIKDRPKSRTETSTVSTAGKSGGRKLSKRSRPRDVPPPIPSTFRNAKSPLGDAPNKGNEVMEREMGRDAAPEGEGVTMRKKKHWWSRRRAGSLAT